MKALPLISMLIAFFILSCESVVKNFEIKKKDPKLNIICFAEADSSPKVFVSRTFSLDEPIDYYQVENINAALYEGGNLISKLETVTENYIIDNNLNYQEGQLYSLEIAADGFPAVYTNFIIPEKKDILYVNSNFEEEVIDFDYTRKILEFDMGIESSGDETEYYELEVIANHVYYEYSEENWEIIDTISTDVFLELVSKSPYITASRYYSSGYSLVEEGYDAYGTALYFTNELMDAGENSIKFAIEQYALSEIEPIEIDSVIQKYEIVIRLNHIDKNIYEYAVSKARNSDSDGNPFVEPVTIYTNIENGVGLAGARTRTELKYDVTEHMDSLIIDDNYYY